MTLWVITKANSGKSGTRAESIQEAYFYLGRVAGRMEKELGVYLAISDMPDAFFDNTYCTLYPEGKDPIGDAVAWITSRGV